MLRREEAMEIMVLKRQGLSRRKIAQRLGIHRKTVDRYLARGGEHKAYDTSSRQSGLFPYRERILAWMEEDAYSSVWMYDRLVAQGYCGSVRTVQRFARREGKQLTRKAFLRFETEPGRQAQVDFGELAVVDGSGKKVETLYLFLMVLGYSRKRYGEMVRRPDLVSFLEAHQRAFRFFGGVPTEILYDCMKNVVTRLGGTEPKWNETFFSFALHEGFAPRLCPPYASWVKGKVERPIRFIREGFWRGYEFRSVPEANQDLLEWLVSKEQVIHGTTHERIDERFEREQGLLGELPQTVFDTSARFFRTVGKDCCIPYGCNRYMTPHGAVGRDVIVRVKDGILRVFDGPELLVTYPVHEGRGHLVAHPHLVQALKTDREQIRMKYRKPLHRCKGAARTIGLLDELAWQVMVPKRNLGEYAALLEGGGAHG
jgi:transposase